MNIVLVEEPFPHVIVEGFLDEEEYHNVWREFVFLAPKMRTPDQTAAASKDRGIPLKRGHGLFIDTFYQKAEDSDTFKAANKILNRPFMEQIAGLDNLYAPFVLVNRSATLMQIYRNGDAYQPHKDASLYTAVYLMHKEPKQYGGGDFYFDQYDYTVPLRSNDMLIFPSVFSHGVSEVKLLSNNIEDARFTATQLLYLTP